MPLPEPTPGGGAPVKRQTIRSQLESFVQMPEKALSDVAREDSVRQLEGPPLPPETAHVVAWWRELADARPSGGFGLGSLSYADLMAWAHLSARIPTPWEVDLILNGDRAFVAEFSATPERPTQYDPLKVMDAFADEDARAAQGIE